MIRKLTWLVCLGVALSGCKDVFNLEAGTSCLGFHSPTLAINVSDSLTDLAITTATVTLYTTDSSSAVTTLTIPWDAVAGSYYVDAATLQPEGSYTVVAMASGYQSAVVKDVAFTPDTSCGASNDWQIDMALCQTGSACI